MFDKTVIHFDHPFCDCEVLDLGSGLFINNGVPSMGFMCQTCGTTINIPFPKLNIGFEFDFMPPGVRIGGEEGGDEEEVRESEKIVEVDNVIYGPWNGSDRPDEKNGDSDE